MPCDLETLRAISLKVVEASPDAKIVINEKREIVIFNQQAELLFGYDRSEVLDKPIEMLLPESARAKHAKNVRGYFSEPRVREMGQGMSLKALHRNGKEFAVQIKLAPMVITGAGVHTLAVVRAIKSNASDLPEAEKL